MKTTDFMILKSAVMQEPAPQATKAATPNFADFNEDIAAKLLDDCLSEDASAGAVGAGAIAVTPGAGLGKNVGSLFGGSYRQPKKKKTETIIKRPKVA